MTSRICKALNIDLQNIKITIVSGDDFPNTLQILENENFNSSDKYLINLTGGTKIMSLGVFNISLIMIQNSFMSQLQPIKLKMFVQEKAYH